MARTGVGPALLLLPLALAACGRQQSADAPSGGADPNGISVRTAPREAVVVSGGDTVASAPTAPAAGSGATEAQPPAAAAPASPVAPAQGGRQDANEILRRVEQTAAGIRTLEADFTQSLRVPLLNTNQASAGKLYQRKPDRFLMRFTEPAGDVMVADGRYFWIYYPSTDRNQVVRTSIAEGGEQADFQKQFLANATDRFVATMNAPEAVGGRPTWSLTLVPKRESPYKVVRIWVDREDYMVRRFEMTEENNSVRRVELRNLKVNQPISDALFTFTPPAGAHVFEQ
ncbi:MAG TPA: outer membrane lipoprotein carrier protein LolA [Longimicrobium sp.]|jgi:chaperone LolA|nr:outer membrane lipoprotein carrier protein LolA [Longimicrobium sp.]